MEYTLKPQEIGCLQTILDTVSEQGVDMDITLPDYCPDIEKVLNCTFSPKIFTQNLSGGQLRVEGAVTVRVLYCDSVKKNVRCFEQTSPFSAGFNVKDLTDQYGVITSTKNEYINCRALSPRKLTVHGAFSLYAKIIGKGCFTAYGPGEDKTLCTKTRKIRGMELSAFCQEQFTVTDEVSLEGRPPVESLLKSEVRILSSQCKAVNGKIMLNGEINMRLMYLSNFETGDIEIVDYVTPYSQIINCEGVTETTVNHINVNLMSGEVRLKGDAFSDNPLIVLDARICFTEMGYVPVDITVIEDSYSTKFASTQQFTGMEVLKSTIPFRDTFMHKSTVKTDGASITKIIDMECTPASSSFSVSEGIKAEGKFNCCITAVGDDGYPVYIERIVDLQRDLSVEAGADNIENLDFFINSMSYRIAEDDSIELRCEIVMTGCAQLRETISGVNYIEISEDKPIEEDGCSLTLYYCDCGEKIWDIAKKYNTSEDLIISENLLEGDRIDEAKMLLITRI